MILEEFKTIRYLTALKFSLIKVFLTTTFQMDNAFPNQNEHHREYEQYPD